MGLRRVRVKCRPASCHLSGTTTGCQQKHLGNLNYPAFLGRILSPEISYRGACLGETGNEAASCPEFAARFVCYGKRESVALKHGSLLSRWGANIAIATFTSSRMRPRPKRAGSTGNIIAQPSPIALI